MRKEEGSKGILSRKQSSFDETLGGKWEKTLRGTWDKSLRGMWEQKTKSLRRIPREKKVSPVKSKTMTSGEVSSKIEKVQKGKLELGVKRKRIFFLLFLLIDFYIYSEKRKQICKEKEMKNEWNAFIKCKIHLVNQKTLKIK